ncbi:MAG: hypothetical protein ACR2PA_06480 [Hyphomicrobiaceae bacterium]
MMSAIAINVCDWNTDKAASLDHGPDALKAKLLQTINDFSEYDHVEGERQEVVTPDPLSSKR